MGMGMIAERHFENESYAARGIFFGVIIGTLIWAGVLTALL